MTGALSSLLWLRIVRAQGSHPSIALFTKVGCVLTPCSILAAMVTLRVVAPNAF